MLYRPAHVQANGLAGGIVLVTQVYRYINAPPPFARILLICDQ
jgi:hypothetical protein